MNELNMTNHEKILYDMEQFHPRAMKLLRKQKNFIVIADDEPYFREAYAMIRDNEIKIGRWSAEDEQAYQNALKKQ